MSIFFSFAWSGQLSIFNWFGSLFFFIIWQKKREKFELFWEKGAAWALPISKRWNWRDTKLQVRKQVGLFFGWLCHWHGLGDKDPTYSHWRMYCVSPCLSGGAFRLLLEANKPPFLWSIVFIYVPPKHNKWDRWEMGVGTLYPLMWTIDLIVPSDDKSTHKLRD